MLGVAPVLGLFLHSSVVTTTADKLIFPKYMLKDLVVARRDLQIWPPAFVLPMQGQTFYEAVYFRAMN